MRCAASLEETLGGRGRAVVFQESRGSGKHALTTELTPYGQVRACGALLGRCPDRRRRPPYGLGAARADPMVSESDYTITTADGQGAADLLKSSRGCVSDCRSLSTAAAGA